jgi:Ca2+-binding RTX toxin-like protein
MPSPSTYTLVTSTKATGNALIDPLLRATQWTGSLLNYSFVEPGSIFSSSYGNPTMTSGAQAFNTTQRGAYAQVAAAVSGVSKMQLALSVDDANFVGDLRLGFASAYDWQGGHSTAFYPAANTNSGDMWFNPAAKDLIAGSYTGSYADSSFQPGSYGYKDLIYASLIALGLKSLGQAGGVNSAVMPAAYDGLSYTLISGKVSAEHPDANGMDYYPTTPMLLDIAALQAMYGANTSYNAGDTTYSFTDAPGQFYNQTIWDGGGSNTLSYSGTTASSIDLRDGHGSMLGNKVYAYSKTDDYAVNNVWIAFGTKIDKAVVVGSAPITFQGNDDGDSFNSGSGDDSITGGAGADSLRGNAGNDSVDGGAGIDTAVYAGRRGDYLVAPGALPGAGLTVSDKRIVLGNDGTDTLVNVERLQFADVGVALDLAPTQAAGKAVLTMAATLGPAWTHDLAWAGTFLKYFSGGASVLNGASLLVDAGIMAAFAGGADNAAFVKFVYANVHGQAPDAVTLALLVAPLNSHTTTQAQWMADMVVSSANQAHVGLVGLAGSGWQFTA